LHRVARLDDVTLLRMIYNATMKLPKISLPISLPIERDYRIFFWFLTLTVGGMYFWSLYSQPGLLQPAPFILFTLLVGVHIGAHWLAGKMLSSRRRVVFYVIVQGLFAFIISWMSGNIGMPFGLYMALLGEAVGMFGMTPASLLSGGYYLVLSLILFTWYTGTGGVTWWLISILPTVVFVTLYVTLYSRQVEANEQARLLLAQLEAANRQLSEYAAQVDDLTIVAERQRMARELHDTLSQGLAGLVLQLEAVDAHLADARPEKARSILQQTMEQARAALADARQVIDDLRQGSGCPSLSPIEEALRREVNRFCDATGISCTVEVSMQSAPPDTVNEAVRRIAAEALTNIARHARAGRVWMTLNQSVTGLVLEIGDDGVGFDPQTVPAGHFGLLGMNERARLAGGSLHVESAPSRGTVVRAEFPTGDGVA